MTEIQDEPDKRGRGRPSLYDPKFCDQVVEFCAEGYSLTAFAGKIGVSRQTISEWCEAHEEFSVAVKIAKAAAGLSLETDAKRVREKGGGPGTSTMIIFGLKNMAPDDYKDQQDHNINGGLTIRIGGEYDGL